MEAPARTRLRPLKPPVGAIDVHAAHGDDPIRETAHGFDHRAGIVFGHRAHVHDRVRIEGSERVAMIGDARAIAVYVPHGHGEIDLVLAAMEHGDLVAIRRELAYDARADEDRSPDDEDATHGPILFHPSWRRVRLSQAVEIVIGVVVVLIATFVAVTVIGRSLPVGHIPSRTATHRRPAEEVWAAMNDPGLMSAVRGPARSRHHPAAAR